MPPTRNATCVIVAPVLGVAATFTIVEVFTTAEDPESGLVIATVAAATVTFTAEDVIEMALLSVTVAVSATEPAAAGVQLTE